jgi:hemolysin D
VGDSRTYDRDWNMDVYVGKIDVVVIATGKVAPDGNIKIVQAPSQGVVQTIRVKEGQTCRAW